MATISSRSCLQEGVKQKVLSIFKASLNDNIVGLLEASRTGHDNSNMVLCTRTNFGVIFRDSLRLW